MSSPRASPPSVSLSARTSLGASSSGRARTSAKSSGSSSMGERLLDVFGQPRAELGLHHRHVRRVAAQIRLEVFLTACFFFDAVLLHVREDCAEATTLFAGNADVVV